MIKEWLLSLIFVILHQKHHHHIRPYFILLLSQIYGVPNFGSVGSNCITMVTYSTAVYVTIAAKKLPKTKLLSFENSCHIPKIQLHLIKSTKNIRVLKSYIHIPNQMIFFNGDFLTLYTLIGVLTHHHHHVRCGIGPWEGAPQWRGCQVIIIIN